MDRTWSSKDRLYHYTTAEGLEGIWGEQALRAFYFRDLNDTTECERMRDPLKKVVGRFVHEYIKVLKKERVVIGAKFRDPRFIRNLASGEASSLVDIPYNLMFNRQSDEEAPNFLYPYILSLCSHTDKDKYTRDNGLLSQWRAYGENGGFALVLDAKKLDSMLVNETSRYFYTFGVLETVRYECGQAEFEEGFKEDVEEYGALVRTILDRTIGRATSQEGELSIKESYSNIARMATLYKHQAFLEEAEVRLIVSPWSQRMYDEQLKEDPKYFDTHKEEAIKCSESQDGRRFLTLFKEEERLPIKKIIVGPSKHQAENLALARKICDDSVDITCSATPFV